MSRKSKTETAAALAAAAPSAAPESARHGPLAYGTEWALARPYLQQGGALRREAATKKYYVDGHGGLTERRIAALERDGVIVRIGADTYALATGAAAAATEDAPAAAVPEPLPAGEARAEAVAAASGVEARYLEIPLAQIYPSPHNPRKRRSPEGLLRTALSIAQKGVLQPILVRPDDRDFTGELTSGNRFEAAIGTRRLAAAALAIEGVADSAGKLWFLPADFKMPCRWGHYSDSDMVVIGGLENLDREDMDEIEEAELFVSMRPHVTPLPGQNREAALADLFGCSERTVNRRIALLRGIPEVQAALLAKKIEIGVAQVLSRGTPAQQKELIDGILSGEYGTPSADDVREFLSQGLPPFAAAAFDPALYDGEFVDDEESGERFFADADRFEALQGAALDTRAAELREQFSWVDIDRIGRLSSWKTHGVAADDPDAGAVLRVVAGDDDDAKAEIEVIHPVLRWATLEERLRTARQGVDDVERRIDAENQDRPRPPLSKAQIDRLHKVKTQALRRAVIEQPERPGNGNVVLVLAILGLAGVHEVRHMAAPGYEPFDHRLPRVDSTKADRDRLAHLVKTAALPLARRAGSRSAGVDETGLTLDGFDSANAAAWFEALLELPLADLAELHARMVAERVGSWIVGPEFGSRGAAYVAQLGDSPLAIAIARATAADSLVPALWQPDLDWFMGYSRARLVAMVRDQVKLRGADHMKKRELAEHCAEQPRGFWHPSMFPELAFQLEAQVKERLDLPLPEPAAEEAAA